MPNIEINHDLFMSYKRDNLYIAGLPGYPRNFSRDTLLAGIIASDKELLTSQLNYSALHQGRKYDGLSGEEPGKIHHEYPGVVHRTPYLTTYNACDTTALYLIAISALHEIDPDIASRFIKEHFDSIKSAVDYIQTHTKDSLFQEFPPINEKQYSLRVTYWKDSIVPSITGTQEPIYPVSYALTQFQAAYGLYSAGKLLEAEELTKQADSMFKKGIEVFITANYFCVLQDLNGRLEQVSSDELHCLRYIPAHYSPLLPMQAITQRAQLLSTKAGIACTPKDVASFLTDKYHGFVVWPFEQALIHAGCLKFNLDHVAKVAERCLQYIKHGQELLELEPSITPSGNDRQLWSVAAKKYFTGYLGLQTNQT